VVIEHAFITTMDPAEAFATAGGFLSERGFRAEAQGAFTIGGGWNGLEIVRGEVTAAKARGVSEYPTRVRLEWDRGRMTIAAQIYAKNDKQEAGFAPLNSATRIDLARVKTAEAMACILYTIVQTLELLLSRRDPAAAGMEWAALDQGLQRRDAGRRKPIGPIAILLIVLGIVAFLVLVIFVVTRSN